MKPATHHRWRLPGWRLLLVLLAGTLMMLAGYWQLQRGDEKKSLIRHMLEAQLAPPLPTAQLAPAKSGAPANVALHGSFDAERQLLQDNQALDQRPGYHVWTPLRLGGGQLVVVDRGWVAQDPDRRVLPVTPVPAGAVAVRGLWRTLPRPGLRLAARDCAARPFPRIVQYPDADELACALGEPVADGLLLMDPADAGGFIRRWQVTPEMPPERHYAYALQWFVMAAALFVLFIKLNLKRKDG